MSTGLTLGRRRKGIVERMRRVWRVTTSLLMLAFPFAVLSVVSSCASNPPADPNNICEIFDEKRGWERAARKAEKRWGLPPHIGLAFVHRESHYVADAQPPRRKLLGIVPWRRLSSAYGYAQATDEAWHDYRKDVRRLFPDRDDFGDALDFIGWYNHRSNKRLKIPKTDAYNLYLAYYSGHGGYERGHWKNSTKIQNYAGKVRRQAERYAGQLQTCS
jgi:hypothetical protein